MTQSLSAAGDHPVSSVARRFLVVGESLVDIVVPADGGEQHRAVGGSCLNVAVGLARLDVPTRLVTRIGEDELGRLVRDHVAASGVELAEDAVVPGAATSTATAHLDEDHAATYDFELEWELAPQQLPSGARGIHVGSLGCTLEPGRRTVLDLAHRAMDEGLFVSYDPNIRPFFLDDPAEAWADVRRAAASARLVKLSDEDLRLLQADGEEEAACRELLAGEATELVVLTRGGEGAVAFTEGSTLPVAAPSTDVVDTVGAGDSFMAAMLALLCEWDVVTDGEGALQALDDAGIELLLRGAVTAAAVTCSRRGANPPTRQELPPTWPAG